MDRARYETMYRQIFKGGELECLFLAFTAKSADVNYYYNVQKWKKKIEYKQ